MIVSPICSITVVGMTLPEPRPFIYLHIFRSVSFSNIDYIAGTGMFAANVISCFASSVAFHYESKNLEKVCLKMGRIGSKLPHKKEYAGRGEDLK